MAANKLIEKLRKQREFVHSLGEGKSLVIRRMSEIQYTDYLTKRKIKEAQGSYIALSDFIKDFVVDWRGFIESDFDNGGDSSTVDYDADLLIEWLQDRVSMCNELSDAIWQSFIDYLARKAETEKK